MKIHIIGCSGSGKTYLAKRLSKKYGVVHIDLDDLQWDNSADAYGVKNSPERRCELLEKVLEQDGWIVEGVYYAWVGRYFEEADVIYVLDVPARVCTARIIRRFIRRKLGIERGKKETLQSLIALLRWTDTFRSKNRKEIETILAPYGDKVRCLRTVREINALAANHFC